MTLPDGPYGDKWQLVLDTAEMLPPKVEPAAEPAGAERHVIARSVVVMRRA